MKKPTPISLLPRSDVAAELGPETVIPPRKTMVSNASAGLEASESASQCGLKKREQPAYAAYGADGSAYPQQQVPAAPVPQSVAYGAVPAFGAYGASGSTYPQQEVPPQTAAYGAYPPKCTAESIEGVLEQSLLTAFNDIMAIKSVLETEAEAVPKPEPQAKFGAETNAEDGPKSGQKPKPEPEAKFGAETNAEDGPKSGQNGTSRKSEYEDEHCEKYQSFFMCW